MKKLRGSLSRENPTAANVRNRRLSGIILAVIMVSCLGINRPLTAEIFSGMRSGCCVVWAAESPNQTDIQWFKEQMKISPKYLEREQGILGMSWAHFFVMIFLGLFFLGALVIVYLRDRKIKQALNNLLREKDDEP